MLGISLRSQGTVTYLKQRSQLPSHPKSGPESATAKRMLVTIFAKAQKAMSREIDTTEV